MLAGACACVDAVGLIGVLLSCVLGVSAVPQAAKEILSKRQQDAVNEFERENDGVSCLFAQTEQFLYCFMEELTTISHLP